MTEDEFRDRIREVKAKYNVSDIIGRVTKLKPAGNEKVGRCFVPGHEDSSPSLSVNDQKGVWLCRGCSATGDIIAAVEIIEKTDFIGAIRWLGATVTLPPADPAARRKASARDDIAQTQRSIDAASIWNQSTALSGTLGEIYLRSRDITSWPETLRFTRTWWWCNYETGETSADYPAVIGRVDRADGLSGIQRIFLRPDGTGKADLAGGKAKLSLGGVRGGALRLGPAAETMLICEGPEDGLSLAQELPGTSVWVSLGTANMSLIKYPDIVRKIVICAQNDAAADRATAKAAGVLIEQGYMVEVRRPRPEFKDWNDQLRATRQDRELVAAASAMDDDFGGYSL